MYYVWGRILLKLILEKDDAKKSTGFKITQDGGTMGGFCEYGNKFSCSITSGNFLSPY
jgi:hypothetical protein